MTTNILRITLLAALASPLTFAQSDVARIVGTVSDASGAVIPGAAVALKNERTGQERKLVTNEQGMYSATQLQPATYSLSAQATGMAQAEYKGINLSVGQERVLNITLQPNTVSTEISVSGGDLAIIDVS